MRNQIKAILKAAGLDGFAGKLYANCWKLARQDGGGDIQIIQEYLSRERIRKLHLACGTNIIDGWLSSDIVPRSRGVVFLDATKRYPFDQETFDYVFSEHMIEHVSFADGNKMLQECYRVLKIGGKIRICTPSLPFLISLYQNEKSQLQRDYLKWSAKTLTGCAPFCEDTFVINNFVRDWGHTFIYDEKVLRFSLDRAGFKEIVSCELNQSEDPVLQNLENGERLPVDFLNLESFTLEGTKR